jgi:CRP-like cAMP-binding protein
LNADIFCGIAIAVGLNTWGSDRDGLLPASERGRADVGVLRPLRRKLNSLGFHDEDELRYLLHKVKLRGGTARGEEIVGVGDTTRSLTVLLAGVACLYETLENGGRQTYAFYYPGDFCDLHRYASPEPEAETAVRALTDCSIGIVEYRDLDQAIERHPKLALALWRTTMLDSSILRERLANASQRPALERVSHLLCEQLHRRRAIGVDGGVIPLSQIDLADAAGLSVVHMNRVLQDLRKLGVISRSGRTIEVVDWERLVEIAKFDNRYLSMPAALSGWDVRVE